jgi:REP element-mobilizing transposase RayT
MARPLRLNIENGWYHCMHRGIDRRTIFADEKDYLHFLELVDELVERYRLRVHAYCLMANHYHAILQTPDANLSVAMQWLGLSYSSWFNARNDRVGPLFQGRFKSVPVEEGAWAHELSLYIHLNPVRTLDFGLDRNRRKADGQGLTRPPSREEVTARLKRLREYPWSSYRAYAGYCRGPAWLVTEDILRRTCRTVADRQRKYREQVVALLSRGIDESRLEAFRSVVGLGSAAFIQKLKQMAGDGNRETERRGRLRERVSFEQVVEAVERVRGQPRTEWLHKHGDPGKWVVLLLARRYTGMSLRALGECMAGMDYAAVCVGLGRFRKRLARDRPLRRLRDDVAQMLHV